MLQLKKAILRVFNVNFNLKNKLELNLDYNFKFYLRFQGNNALCESNSNLFLY